MRLFVDLVAIWIVLRWVIPIVVLLGLAYLAYRWANKRDQGEFTSAEPRDRERRD